MSSRTLTSLIGSRIFASIGEPWNFESEAGRACLRGEVVATPGRDEEPDWLLCSVQPFVRDGQSVRHVIPVRRYCDESVANLLSGMWVEANLFFDPKHPMIDRSRVEEVLSPKTEFPFLIGGIAIDRTAEGLTFESERREPPEMTLTEALTACTDLFRQVGETQWCSKIDDLVRGRGEIDYKDARDVLRWYCGKDSLNALIISAENGHRVNPGEEASLNDQLDELRRALHERARRKLENR